MFDVFYLDKPAGLFPHERLAESIDHARQMSRTRFFWVVNYLVDYSNFDFLWEPVPWEAHQAHVWPSQHQSNSGTWLCPKIAHADVNRNHPALKTVSKIPRVHIKHCAESAAIENVHTVRFFSDYLGTLKRALSKINSNWCWVTADVCDYSNFDFSWHPSEWQQTMLHVFASDEQKFGDTFYVHVPSFLEKSQDLKILEWFDTIHFVENISVPRLPMPSVYYQSDSMVDAVWAHEFKTPLVEFTNQQLDNHSIPTVSLWQEKLRTIVPLSSGNGVAVIPRDVKNRLKSQIYDYDYIDRMWVSLNGQPLDIVFISNGEPNAEDNFKHLKNSTSNCANSLLRVDGVKGRVAAYHAAASISSTPWFFAVFAKLYVNEIFDWSWQPDRFQQPKHYIFHAHNPVNSLVYGHQAMIAYNRQLVLQNPGSGLDFTLDSPHEVVPILSGTAFFNVSPWVAWRTAFREVLKLKALLPDIDAEYRIGRWCEPVTGEINQYSYFGACDAVEYYDQVQGDFEKLRLSYDWPWLAAYAAAKRQIHPD